MEIGEEVVQAVTERVVEVLKELEARRTWCREHNVCFHCGEAYAACRYPVSHAIPSIDSIKLPAEVNNIALRYKNGETTASLTSYEREIWDRTANLGHAHF